MNSNSIIAHRVLAMVGAFAITIGLLAGSFATAPQSAVFASAMV